MSGSALSETQVNIRPNMVGNRTVIQMCGQPASGGCALWRRVFTMEEAAGICSVHRTTMTRIALAGDLVTSMIGERRLVDEYQLEMYIERSSGRALFAVPSAGSGLMDAFGFPGNRFCAKKNESGLYVCPMALTVREAALAIRVHWTTLAKFVASGKLKSSKIGSARRIFSYDLWTFFENRAGGKDASFHGKEAC